MNIEKIALLLRHSNASTTFNYVGKGEVNKKALIDFENLSKDEELAVKKQPKTKSKVKKRTIKQNLKKKENKHLPIK
jgi:hypothetical protein